MTAKRYNVWDIEGTIFLEDHKEGSYHIGQVGNVDINCLNDIANRLNDLTDENEQLKKQIGNLEHTRDFCADVCADCERLEKENENLKIRFREERDTAMRLGRECDNLAIKNQKLELEIQRLEMIIRTGEKND